MIDAIGGWVLGATVAIVASVFTYVNNCGEIGERAARGVEVTITGPAAVTRGVPATFVVTEQGFGAGKDCPAVANWTVRSRVFKNSGADGITVRNLAQKRLANGSCVVTTSVTSSFAGFATGDKPEEAAVQIELLANGGLDIAEGEKRVEVRPAARPVPTTPATTATGGSTTSPTGQTKPPTAIQYQAGQHIVDVMVNDFDAGTTGRDVLAIDNSDSVTGEKIVVFPAAADGTLGTPKTTPLGAELDPDAGAAGDIDLDGDIDVVMTSVKEEKLVWFSNDGDGTFTRVDSGSTLDVPSPTDVVLTNYDGDGDLDLIAPGGGVIYKFAGAGGAFTGDGSLLPNGGGSTNQIAVGELGGPAANRPDIAITQFDQDRVVVMPGATNQWDCPCPTFPAGNGPLGIALGPLRTGSTSNDLVVSDHLEHKITRLINNGTAGSFGFNTLGDAPRDGDAPIAILMRDINNDGDNDVVVTNFGTSTFAFYEGDGQGGLAPPVFVPTASGPDAVTASDLDGDGQRDVITGGFTDGKVQVHLTKPTTAAAVAVAASARRGVRASAAQTRLKRGQFRISARSISFEPLTASSSSFSPAGDGILKGLRVRGSLGARLTGSRPPRGLREVLSSRFVGRVDARRFFAPPTNPITVNGYLLGRATRDRKTLACLRVFTRTTGGVTTHAFRLAGGTGRAAKLTLSASGLPTLSVDVPQPGAGTIALTAKQGKKARKMPAACRALIRQLPRR